MTLYEMSDTARALLSMLEDGDIDEQTFADTLESIGADEKVDSYCAIIRQEQAEAEKIAAEIKRMTAKKQTCENAVERMKAALMEFVSATGGKAKTTLFSVSVRSTQSADILDENAIPAEYREPQPDKIRRADILKALKAGATVEGAALKSTDSITIR